MGDFSACQIFQLGIVVLMIIDFLLMFWFLMMSFEAMDGDYELPPSNPLDWFEIVSRRSKPGNPRPLNPRIWLQLFRAIICFVVFFVLAAVLSVSFKG